MYNWNVGEENDELLSLHKTKQGADEAIKKDKEYREKEYSECRTNSSDYYTKFMQNCRWSICEYELFD